MSFDFLEVVIFAVLSIVVVGGGAMVVLLGRITSAALFMALTFLGIAGMFVMADLASATTSIDSRD